MVVVNTVTKVGDTLTVEFKYAQKRMKERTTLLQFDFEYNNKLLQYQSVTWKTPTVHNYIKKLDWV